MFKKKLLVRAMAAAFGVVAVGGSLAPSAYAQTNATGSIVGKVDNPAGATVSIENAGTGFRRTLTPDADGRYQFTSLPVGRYKVTVSRGGAVAGVQDNVEVLIGQSAEVSFGSLQTVQISGRRQTIDVQNTNSGSTFSSTQLEQIPLARSVSAVIQLAPNSTRGDTRYGGVDAPSIGGASSSENSYYINGYPVTNIFFQVGYSQLPFGAISQAQVLAGGYGAEFGRSVGGVVNITTKSGTNEWVAGGAIAWDPKQLRARPKDQYYDNTGRFPATDGKLYFWNAENTQERTSFSGYIGGPIIKDKLFFFFAGEQTETKTDGSRFASDNAASKTAGWQSRKLTVPRYLAKVDWNLTDDHRLEWTHISDEYKDSRKYSGLTYSNTNGPSRNGGVVGGDDYINWGPTPVAAPQGAKIDILKYTGNLTNDLTVTALAGRTTQKHVQTPSGYTPGLFQVVAAPENQAPGLTYNSTQTASGTLERPGANDKQTAYRLDLEYKLGRHTLRAGVDYVSQKSLAGEELAGGGQWVYLKGDPNLMVSAGGNTPPFLGTPASGGGLGAQGYYVEKDLQNTFDQPQVVQSAQYIEDRWQITDRFLLSLGLRNEQFTNKNGQGQAYIKQTKQLEPRVGASWDLNGDASMKVFGNLGRYHIQIPTSIALRGAGASLNTQTYYTYTGVDANGLPTGLTQITPPLSGNGEFGVPRDARTVSDQNLKGMYQDELSFGFERALSKDLNVGAKVTYRKLGTAIDDWCDSRPFEAWAARNGLGTAGLKGDCFLVNPGRPATFQYDVDGDGKLETVNLSAADMGLDKATRKYFALDLTAEHPFDGKWYGKVTYTLSKNWGNTEGQLLSDLGQADVGATQTWDFPEFSRGADGLLPNNRKHQLKAFGYYQMTPQWGFGANLLIASGRPRNCKGVDPTETSAPYFGAYTSPNFFCFGQPTSRGSYGTLPWDTRLDLNVAYKPDFLKGLLFKLDVFNVFNRQSVEVVEERYYTRTGVLRAVGGRVVSYTAPRSMRLTAAYDYKF